MAFLCAGLDRCRIWAVTETIDNVIVYHSDGLHMGINDRRRASASSCFRSLGKSACADHVVSLDRCSDLGSASPLAASSDNRKDRSRTETIQSIGKASRNANASGRLSIASLVRAANFNCSRETSPCLIGALSANNRHDSLTSESSFRPINQGPPQGGSWTGADNAQPCALASKTRSPYRGKEDQLAPKNLGPLASARCHCRNPPANSESREEMQT